jgi:hypothetical protein
MICLAVCLVSLFVGGLITWLAARCYYMKSSEDLRNESKELRRLSEIVLLGMENAGFIELNKDLSLGEMKITGLSVTVRPLVLGAKAGLEVSADITHEDKKKD